MTRTGPRKQVDEHFWLGRRDQARAFKDAAEQALTLADDGANTNPIVSLVVLAAIAYGDALTAKRAQVINQQDHAAAPRLLRDVLRDALPDAQERRYKRMLANKDAAQYGARSATLDHARRLYGDLCEFAAWAEQQV